MSTTGPWLGSRSARVPESLRSLPVSSGGPSGLFGSFLNMYQVRLVGVAFTPGHATASVPHETTTVFFGTPKTTYVGFFSFVPALTLAGGAACSERAGCDELCSERGLIWSRFAGFVSKSA